MLTSVLWRRVQAYCIVYQQVLQTQDTVVYPVLRIVSAHVLLQMKTTNVSGMYASQLGKS